MVDGRWWWRFGCCCAGWEGDVSVLSRSNGLRPAVNRCGREQRVCCGAMCRNLWVSYMLHVGTQGVSTGNRKLGCVYVNAYAESGSLNTMPCRAPRKKLSK